MAVLWVVAPCSLIEVHQRFRGPCCLRHQGDLIAIASTIKRSNIDKIIVQGSLFTFECVCWLMMLYAVT
jgi:hypothetical protein